MQAQRASNDYHRGKQGGNVPNAKKRKMIKIRMEYDQACPDHVVGSNIVRTIVAKIPATFTIS